MTQNSFQFTADRSTAQVKTRKELAAPRDLVWRCFSEKALIDRWIAPKPMTAKTQHLDFREGGYWHFAMIDLEGTHYWSRWDYETIQPKDLIVAKDGFTDETGVVNADMPTSISTSRFSDLPNGTLIEALVQYPSTEMMEMVINMGMEEGWRSTVERLDELLIDLQ